MTHDDKVLIICSLRAMRNTVERTQRKQATGSGLWFAYAEEIKKIDDAVARIEKEPSK